MTFRTIRQCVHQQQCFSKKKFKIFTLQPSKHFDSQGMYLLSNSILFWSDFNISIFLEIQFSEMCCFLFFCFHFHGCFVANWNFTWKNNFFLKNENVLNCKRIQIILCWHFGNVKWWFWILYGISYVLYLYSDFNTKIHGYLQTCWLIIWHHFMEISLMITNVMNAKLLFTMQQYWSFPAKTLLIVKIGKY